LIGATGTAGTFTKEVIELMCSFNDRPIVFALSNPTANAEITAEDAYRFSGGRVVFASGSPFPALDVGGGKFWRPGQGNNAYVFPGVGLGVIGCQAKRVTDAMFLAAARALADTVSQTDLDDGALYPPLGNIRAVSLNIAERVAEQVYSDNLTAFPRPASLRQHLADMMYDPIY
jgi:malate dehydrogenase (oxaloacetate-decarboxylating)(NADP+)